MFSTASRYAGLPPLLQTVLFVVAVLIVGYYFGREALEELIKEREIGLAPPLLGSASKGTTR